MYLNIYIIFSLLILIIYMSYKAGYNDGVQKALTHVFKELIDLKIIKIDNSVNRPRIIQHN